MKLNIDTYKIYYSIKKEVLNIIDYYRQKQLKHSKSYQILLKKCERITNIGRLDMITIEDIRKIALAGRCESCRKVLEILKEYDNNYTKEYK